MPNKEKERSILERENVMWQRQAGARMFRNSQWLSVVEMEDSLVGETAEGVRSEGRRPGSPAASAVSSAPVR